MLCKKFIFIMLRTPLWRYVQPEPRYSTCLSSKVLCFLTRFCPQPALRKKCPYSELFWSAFFPHSDWIQRDTEYLSVFSPNAEKFEKNTDQNNFEYGHFVHSAGLSRWHTSLQHPHAHLNFNVHETVFVLVHFFNLLNNSIFQFLYILTISVLIVVKSKSKLCNCTTDLPPHMV